MNKSNLPLNRVSLTNALFAEPRFFAVSVDHAKNTKTHHFTAVLKGTAIADKYQGSNFLFKLSCSSSLNDVIAPLDFKCTLINTAELNKAHADIEVDLNNIQHGLHEVVKTNLQRIKELSDDFYQHQRKFIPIDCSSADSLKQNSVYIELKKGRISNSLPYHLQWQDYEVYFDGYLIYLDELQIPNTLEPSNYSITDTAVQPTLISNNAEVLTMSALFKVCSYYDSDCAAVSVFKNTATNASETLTTRFNNLSEALNQLNEIWFDRYRIYKTISSIANQEAQQLLPSMQKFTGRQYAAMHSLLGQLMLEPNHFEHQTEKNIVQWSGKIDFVTYALALHYSVDFNHKVKFFGAEFLEDGKVLHSLDIEAMKTIAVRPLLRTADCLQYEIREEIGSFS